MSVRGTCEPWGKAVFGPNCGPPPPDDPSFWVAAAMAPARSRVDMPSRSVLKPSRKAILVMRLARSMKAISLAVFVPRQPSVTGAPSTTWTAASVRRRPKTSKARRSGAAPSLPGRGADILEDAADRRVGVFVLLPGPDLLAGRDELLGPLGLEGRADPDQGPSCG